MKTVINTTRAALGLAAWLATAGSGWCFYNPHTGRWLSRDPIEEKGGKNVYGFVGNNPATRVDRDGRRWDPAALVPFCCKGKFYNPSTHCCCRNRVLSRHEQPTGIKFCGIGSDQGAYPHGWIEVDGMSAGFYSASDAISGTLGSVHSPDEYADRPEKSCTELKLSPCDADIQKLKENLLAVILEEMLNPPGYDWVFYNCYHWRTHMYFEARMRTSCGDGILPPGQYSID